VRIEQLLAGGAPRALFDGAERWVQALVQETAALPEPESTRWSALFEHLLAASAQKPSRKWLKEALYFNSDRPTDGVDRDPRLNLPFDIYVSRRACLECPWEPAQNLGAPVNGPRAVDNDGAAALSHDGRLLFWSSNREGSIGASEDLWMTWRANPGDDSGWGEPVNLGPHVNTAAHESGPSYVVAAPCGHAQLYFGRGQEVMVVTISREGEALAPAVPVAGVARWGSPSVRLDGREMILWSSTKGGLGGADVFVSTRANPTAPWPEPVNIGPPVNTAGGELEAAISYDGQSLVFSGTETRGFSLGRQDIWMALRTRGGEPR
jgi:hypothetical protein